MAEQSKAVCDALAHYERMRVRVLDPLLEAEFKQGQLAEAASCYAHYGRKGDFVKSAQRMQAARRYAETKWKPPGWPWAAEKFKADSRRAMLVAAASFLLCEVERMDREDPEA